ncbi:MAG TPA: hypothetical protein VMB78_01020, partial [Dissulfurispiraceae bacterium]|nr:hypothetical protein [Dissulfurispiraceae bacterium]
MHDITEYLFRTNAIKVADPKTPFWYTSGLIGPFYVNTHYLAGGRVAALELLDLITEHPQGISAIHQKVMEIH